MEKEMQMQKDNQNFRAWRVPALLVFLTHSMIVPAGGAGQTLAVRGVVSTSALPVRYASVTFLDASDTTKKVSALTDTSGRYSIDLSTSVRDVSIQPSKFELEQNYPNPFTASTAIAYKLNAPSEAQVTIFDILGREIRRIAVGPQEAGSHGVLWDGKNDFGIKTAAGIYFYRLQANGQTQVKKMVLGAGGENVFVLPSQIMISRKAEMNKRSDVCLGGGTYTIRIENKDATFPEIVPQQFGNVVLQSDTTLNLTVSTNGVFPDPNAAVIYFDSPQQVIRGFGGANILRWRPDMTADQVQKAFGNGPGQIGFTILRLRVPYVSTEDEFSYQIPTAKLAASLGAIVFASPWTPPPAMKSSNNIVGGTLKESSYADYAAHLKGFADYMAAHGAPLYAISLQNEPDANVTYESCSWTGAQFLKFMKNNAASIGTRIMMPESQNFRHTLSDPTLNDSTAAANTAIIAGHLYGGGLESYPLAASKGKEIWMSEYLELDTTWSAVLGTGKQISDCMKVNMNAYVWWYIVRFYGPIGEDGKVSKRGYVMSQFARFVRPGFTRVNTVDNNQKTKVDVTAYRDGDRRVIIAINRNTIAKSHLFTIWNGTAGAYTPYVTSKSRNCEQQNTIGYKNGCFTYTLEPLSITTFVSN
jgi:glucuronoarabinoxylan endo-1,4-beta-xylanase